MQRQPTDTVTELARIAARARREPTAKFVNLMHLLSVDFLSECFQELNKKAAAGIDGAAEGSPALP